MNRRTVLAGAGAALTPLAGCVSGMSGFDGSCDPLTGLDTQIESDEGFPDVVVDPDEPTEEHLTIAVEARRGFDEDAPTRIEITVVNDSDEDRTLSFLMLTPFPPEVGHHTETDAMLALEPDEYDGHGVEFPSEPVDGCWRTDEALDIVDVTDSSTVDSCATVSRAYDVYAYGDDACLEEGEYRFESTDIGELGHDWGFTLILSETL